MIFKILSTLSVHTPISVFNMNYFHVVGMAEFCIKLIHRQCMKTCSGLKSSGLHSGRAAPPTWLLGHDHPCGGVGLPALFKDT